MFTDFMKYLLPISIVVVTFIFVIVILIIRSKNIRLKNEQKMMLYEKAIEKGVTLPDNIFEEKEEKSNSLKSGVNLIATGVGVGIFLGVGAYSNSPSNTLPAISIGLMIVFIGIGYVINHFLEKRKEMADDEE